MGERADVVIVGGGIVGLALAREIAEPLLAGKFVLRFRYTKPDGQVTIDLRQAPRESWSVIIGAFKAGREIAGTTEFNYAAELI